MRKTLILLSLLLCHVTFSMAQHGQYVGGDLSMLPAYEQHNSAYLDAKGNKIPDLLIYLRDVAGWNAVRVRLFVNPKEKSPREGIIQDLEYVKNLGKRIKDAGMCFMLDFHYSDTWADPTNQKLPSAWSDCTTAEKKAQRLYDYTKESLQALKEAGATPDLVQIGNEISYGIVGIQVHPYTMDGDDWSGYVAALNNCSKAVREICPAAKIVVHTERAGNTAQTLYYYNQIAGVGYDIIGLSYYPIWHGKLSQLNTTLKALSDQFADKDIHIVETAYNFQYWPTKGVIYDTQDTWSCSADGQYTFIKDLIAQVKENQQVKGLFYWFPEEAGCGDDSDWNNGGATVIGSWLNRGLWYEDQTQSGHWPVVSKEGDIPSLMHSFLSEEAANITIPAVISQREGVYNLAGQKVDINQMPRGIYIKNGKKTIMK